MDTLINGGIYKIVCPDGLVLAANEFGYHDCENVVRQEYSYDLNQAWRLEQNGEGKWKLFNLAANMGLAWLGHKHNKLNPYRLFPGWAGPFVLTETEDGWLIGEKGAAMTIEGSPYQPMVLGEGTPFRFELITANPGELPRMLIVHGEVDAAGVPELFKDGDWYYCVVDNFLRRNDVGRVGILRSPDLINWRKYDDLLPQGKPRPFPWMEEHVPDCEIWCPGIAKFGGKYWIYYACTRTCRNTTAMGVVSNVTLDKDDPRYAWKDEGIVMETFESDDWNAIDPHIIHTYDDEIWMVYGSAWSGIKVRRINEETGKVYDDQVYSVAYREEFPHPAEGGYVFKRNGWYYLICAVERTDQNYRCVVGRSRDIRGPYVDKQGVSLMDEGGETIVEYKPGLYKPGHSAVFQDGEKYYIACESWQCRCPTTELVISTLSWDADWPDSAASREYLKRYEK